MDKVRYGIIFYTHAVLNTLEDQLRPNPYTCNLINVKNMHPHRD